MNKLLLIGLGCILMLSACKTKPSAASAAKTMSVKALSKQLEDAAFKFDWLSAKARVNFDDGKIKQSFTANIRMKDDEVIWMSLTGPFGIEGGRVLIANDTVQILDRLNRNYYKEPLSYLSTYAPIKLDMNLLQNILVGNSFQNPLPKQSIANPNSTNNMYVAQGGMKDIDAIYTILPDLFRYEQVELTEDGKARELNMTFENYKEVENDHFAFDRELNFTESEKEVKVIMSFTKVNKEKKLDFPFSVPSRYKDKSSGK